MAERKKLPPEKLPPTSADLAVVTPLPFSSASSAADAPTLVDGAVVITPKARTGSGAHSSLSLLQAGTMLAQRYEILSVLGEGGMGAVYKARDHELDRIVGLKVIRPELSGNPDILHRFKQEILLASRITDRNIIRIYDFGDSDGIKFITMEYIDGEDLSAILHSRGKLPPEEAVAIIEQVVSGLNCAHREGIIHRDLKPGNIMRDATGRVVVMDFGLARVVVGDGLTQSGLLVGTMEYMSPEQAQAKSLDARSDIFTVGLILFELLTGKMPYKAESAIASLIKRTQERAITVSDLEKTVPPGLSAIIARCLERDPKHRYQTSTALLADLKDFSATGAAASLRFHSLGTLGRTLPWSKISVGLAVVVLAGAGYLFDHHKSSTLPTPAPTVQASLAIVPFRNASGDPSMSWLSGSLADMLSTDIGQSERLRTVPQNRLHQVFTDLHLSDDAQLDPSTLKRLAEFSNSDTLVWGQYAKFGDQIRIDATVQDLRHDTQDHVRAEAATEKEIPDAINRLAESIRQKLGVSPDVLKQLQASSFLPSSKSIAAIRNYNGALQLLRAGNNLEAEKGFSAAVKEDPRFALAFSKLGETYANLGYDSEAEQSARKAVELSEDLPPSEKYVIAASHARIAKDYPKAIEAYENLIKVRPDDSDVLSALASLYEDSGDFSKAAHQYQSILSSDPKNIAALLAVGRVSIKSGDSQASLEPLNRALSLAIQVDNQEQKAAILQALGIAYSFLNKPEEALRNYEQSLEIKRKLGQKKGIADSLNMIASAYDGLGKSDLALKNYNEALATYKEIGDRQDVGNVEINLGQFYHDRGKYDDALKLFKASLQIQRDLGNENYQGTCLNNIGNAYLFKGDYDNARTYFEQALQLREKMKVPSDIADTLHNLGETLVRVGQLEQALSKYLRALDLRRQANDAAGAAKESDSMGIVFANQGRYGAALKSRNDAVNGFRAVGDRSFWMSETLGGSGNALSLVGNFEEANKRFEEALSLARELKNTDLIAQILAWKSENSYYAGDGKAALAFQEQAVQSAAKTSDQALRINLQVNSFRTGAGQNAAPGAIARLKALSQEAEGAGLKSLAAEASLYAAEKLLQSRNYGEARPALERLVADTEKLGTKPLSTKAHFLLAEVLRLSGNTTESTNEYRSALTSIDEMKKDAGDGILRRSDLKSIANQASRWTGLSAQK